MSSKGYAICNALEFKNTAEGLSLSFLLAGN